MRKQKAKMKYIAAIALMLNLGVASVYAQRYPVKMAYSGTSGPSAVNLQQPGTDCRREFRRERCTGTIHFSSYKRRDNFSAAAAKHLLWPS
jgi:hypothetical protein